MKKLLVLLVCALSLQLTAQSSGQNWLTNYKTALTTAASLNQPILTFVTDGSNSKALQLLEEELFDTETFRSLKGKVVFLKMDITSSNVDARRHATHFTKSESVPALGLVDQYKEMIGEPLNEITSENINAFIALLNTTF